MGFGLNNQLVLDVFSTSQMRGVFDDRAMLQGWLDAERALAEAQADLGIIPADAAAEIALHCVADQYDMDALAAEILETGHPLVPIVRELIRKSGEAGKFAHWGATTQDIVDTGLILQCKQGLNLIETDIVAVLNFLNPLAAKYRDQPMAGRTHFQHAAPVTFGKKVAIWIDELTDVLLRLRRVRAEMTGQFAGAVGTLAALNGRGPETLNAMCGKLGLRSSAVPWHTSRARFRDIVNVLLEFAAAAERIGIEIALMMSTEQQEASEPISPKHVGSSTMPQKRNPHTSEFMVTAARLMRGAAAPLVTHSAHSYEREMTSWAIEWIAIPQIFGLGSGIGQHLKHISDGMEVFPENMERVLGLTKGQIMSESVMMQLANVLGHEGAHEIIFECAGAVGKSNTSLKEALVADARVTAHLSAAEIERALDPTAYLGDCGVIVDAAIGRANEVLEKQGD